MPRASGHREAPRDSRAQQQTTEKQGRLLKLGAQLMCGFVQVYSASAYINYQYSILFWKTHELNCLKNLLGTGPNTYIVNCVKYTTTSAI